MSYYSDESENPFGSDPHAKWSQPRRSPGPIFFGAIIGVLVFAGIGVMVSLNQPDKLPPREEELAEEKFRETAAAFDSTTLGTDDEEVAEIHKLFLDLGSALRAADTDKLGNLF